MVNQFRVENSPWPGRPDRGTQTASLELTFVPPEGSRFALPGSINWFQTVRTNSRGGSEPVSSADEYPIHPPVAFVDGYLDTGPDRQRAQFWNAAAHTFHDYPARDNLADRLTTWQAQTSCVGITEQGNERLITLSWGFTIDQRGRGREIPLTPIRSPSPYHLQKFGELPHQHPQEEQRPRAGGKGPQRSDVYSSTDNDMKKEYPNRRFLTVHLIRIKPIRIDQTRFLTAPLAGSAITSHAWLAAFLGLAVLFAPSPARPFAPTERPANDWLRPPDRQPLAKSPSQALVDQANAKAERGDQAGALRDLEQALQADPNNFWAYISRGLIYLRMGDYGKVIVDATNAIAINPANSDNWSPYNMRAMAYYLKRQFREAAQDWQAAQQFALPPRFLPINLYSRCDALRLSGDLPAAIADCSESIRLAPSPEAYDNRGMVYAQQGNHAQALSDFKTAARGFGTRASYAELDAVVRRILEMQSVIGKLSLPVPKSWQFPQVIDLARTITPRNRAGRPFDRDGLAYSLEQLNALPVLTLSPAELQNYADIVTHAFPDAAFIRTTSLMSCGTIPADQLNTTAIANLAFVSLQAKCPANRAEAAICLQELLTIWRQRQAPAQGTP